MRYSFRFIFSLIAAPFTAALTIPRSAEDGFYVGYYDESGNQVHVKNPSQAEMATLSAKAYPAPGGYLNSTSEDSLEEREIHNAYCGCGHNLDHGDCDAAVIGLRAQFEPEATVPRYLAWYAIRGSVVAFACNSNFLSESTCTSDIIEDAYGGITKACGGYVAGTWWSPYQFNFGYMDYYDGLDFCHSARASSETSC